MPARIWSNLFLKVLWAVILNFRPSTFETARFTDLLSKGLKKTRPRQVDFPFGKWLSVFLVRRAGTQASHSPTTFFDSDFEKKRYALGSRVIKCLDEETTIYKVVLLMAWRSLTAQKWLPSTWSKSAPIKFLSRIKIAAMGTKTLCLFLKFSKFLRASFSFSVQNLTQQRYNFLKL